MNKSEVSPNHYVSFPVLLHRLTDSAPWSLHLNLLTKCNVSVKWPTVIPAVGVENEYGYLDETLQLLKTCDKGNLMNLWETF
jgi:hypothetical protein